MSSLSVTNIVSKTSNTPPMFKELGGSEVGQLCRAWVSFNTNTTTSIHDSFNVSSLTDNGVGDTTINFTISMPNANYVVIVNRGVTAGFNYSSGIKEGGVYTATAVQVATLLNTALNDGAQISVSVFSN